MSTICLNMIVKNEASVLPRCLASVRDLIDYYVIVVDDATTDGTGDVIVSELSGISGELLLRPWRNSFGKARTEAFMLAKGKADYVLVLDADEEIVLDHMVYPGALKANLRADSYMIRTEDHGLEYDRMRLLKADLDWRFEGVAHEYPTCEAATPDGRLEGIRVRSHGDGARSKDPAKFIKAAEMLSEALAKDPTNARYAFYLAESYRDAMRFPTALYAYRKRVEMGGWDEEVFWSLLQIARIRERHREPDHVVSDAYLLAYEFRPTRAEPLYELARYYSERKRHHMAFLYAQRACFITKPNDTLFIDPSVYEWRALDLFALSAYWSGENEASASAYLILRDRAPKSELERIEKNIEYCMQRRTK